MRKIWFSFLSLRNWAAAASPGGTEGPFFSFHHCAYHARLTLRAKPAKTPIRAGPLASKSSVSSLQTRPSWAGIFKESMGARNRGGIGLSYRPAGGIHSLELTPGLHKRLQIRALSRRWLGAVMRTAMVTSAVRSSTIFVKSSTFHRQVQVLLESRKKINRAISLHMAK